MESTLGEGAMKVSGASANWRAAPRRPTGILALFWACLEAAASGRTEHRPIGALYPETMMRRIAFTAGGGLGWRLSALTTPRAATAPWKIVVITGAPSWAEYWAPTLAALPQNREMIVVDRPGFAASEPAACVPDIGDQARALAPLLEAAPEQRILLVGQSYGAAIAALMAAAAPGRVAGVVLLSAYLGEAGPTARWLVRTGSRFLNLIPRDLRNAVLEVSHQAPQMPRMRAALDRLRAPIHVIHGDRDDFAPIETARTFAKSLRARRGVRFHSVPGANHFLNDGPTDILIACLEACIPKGAKAAQGWRWPAWAKVASAPTPTPLNAAARS
ncbi:MAG: alpha/beta fold hydrolase [Caulobacteraceae bacterium]